jgi:hypothetical protein
VNAALISSLVIKPSASVSAALKKSDTSCSVALPGRILICSTGTGLAGYVSFLAGS